MCCGGVCGASIGDRDSSRLIRVAQMKFGYGVKNGKENKRKLR